MSYSLLQRFLESEHFNRDPSLTIQYLARYPDHVGIQYALCSKLRLFSYEELEFFLPQLCHLLVSVDNESMALEEFILDLCEESVNSALLTFWLFQTYLYDHSKNPNTFHFRTCRRIFNKVQRIVFGADTRREKIKENVLPVTVLASIVLASIAAPFLPMHAGPLAIAQARRPVPSEDTISETIDPQSPKIRRSHTVSGDGARQRRSRRDVSGRSQRPGSSGGAEKATVKSDEEGRSKEVPPIVVAKVDRLSMLDSENTEAGLSSASLPLPNPVSRTDAVAIPSPPRSAGLTRPRPTDKGGRKASHISRPVTAATLSRQQKIKLLRSNYFRSETAFLAALVDISNRLVAVPKPARPSALKAELALIAQDLPAEVDIPVICPANLVDGEPARSRHHRIVRLNPAEATSLNSAERVPYLLMVEVLTEDFDFDPDTEENQHLVSRLLAEKGDTRKRRLFDITDINRDPISQAISRNTTTTNGVAEADTGDIANVAAPSSLENGSENPMHATADAALSDPNTLPNKSSAAMIASGAFPRPSLTVGTSPRTSLSRSSTPDPRRMTMMGGRTTEAPDVSALATHMRMAAQMLAQLEQSSAKRPKAEVLAIRNKIIASMQSLEEQSFLLDEPGQTGQTLETVIADVEAAASADLPQAVDGLDDQVIDPAAGAARMENDQATGGVHRQGDRDDPSAANFGEEWAAKKERIRKTSPFGWMKNWDLISVIVKTGADLRQEAFACQLIQVCGRIWENADVTVWVKEMRILVTGESSGLIETITNGVSLHSIKRSLTLANIAAAAAENTAAMNAPNSSATTPPITATTTTTTPAKPTRQARPKPPGIATLADHFLKAFGPPDSPAHTAAVSAFTRSLAAYSIISYVLQLKDRHNGNILIDNAGHIVHIDFGFMLSNSPGSMGFEAAPFKLTQEYIDVLGGSTSAPAFLEFKRLCKAAFQALRREAEQIVMLVEVMGRQSAFPCFASGVQTAVNALRARFVLHLSREEAEGFVDELVAKSAGSYYTRLYDTFQYRTQGIY